MSSIAAFSRRRRRNAIIVTDFTPVDLIWQDGPPSLASIGATTYSRAVARNAAHQIIPQANQPTITYSSGTTSVATINSSGVVTAVANGTSVITAASAGLTSITQTATVQQVAASVTVSPTTFSITDAGSQQLTATVKDANNNAISGASVTWASDAPSTATVNSSGLVTGQGPGTVHITASSGGFSATSTGTISHVTYTLTVTPNPVSGTNGSTVQLTVMEDSGSGPVDVTADAGTTYSIANTAVATVDAPALTSVSPNTITQGASGSYTFTGTNIKGTETIGGLPTGVSASGYTYTSTTVVCTLTATAGATTGAASVYLAASGRGNSGTQTLTVNSSGGTASTLTSVAPNSLPAGTTWATTFTGTNFNATTGPVFSTTDLSASSVVDVSSTSVTANVTAISAATVGTDTVHMHDTSATFTDSGNQNISVAASTTQLVTSPNDGTNAAWTAVGGAVASTVTSIVLPDGTTGSVTSIGSATASHAGVEQQVTVAGGTASKTFTVSGWFRAVSGTVSVALKNTQGGVVDNFSSNTSVGTTWKQLTFQVTNGASAGTGKQVIGLLSGTGGPGSFYVWGGYMTTP